MPTSSLLLETPCSSSTSSGATQGQCRRFGPSYRPPRHLHLSTGRSKLSLRVAAVLSKDAPASPSGPSDKRGSPFSSSASQTAGVPLASEQQLADPILARQLNQLLRLPPSTDDSDTPTTTSTTPAAPAHSTPSTRQQQAPPRSTTGPEAGPGAVYFFAYGTSLHRDALYDADVRVLSRDAAVVVDPSMQLVFRHRGGQATLMDVRGQPQPLFSPPGSRVHGVLYRMEEDQLTRLHQGLQGYELREVEIQTYAGYRVRALAMVSSRMALLPREVPPTESYMRQLRDGAADQVLDPSYQAWLSSIDTVPCAGLPVEYYATPSKHAWSMAASLGLVALLVAFLSQM